jgi:hypothetical protein
MDNDTMNDDTYNDFAALGGHELSRRGVLRIGGLTLAIAALVAACSDENGDANPARVGDLTPVPTLPDGIVTDGTLFRTATSIHYSIIDLHDLAKKLGKLTADQTAIVDDFIAANKAAIADLQTWTVTAGSAKWTCANPRFDRVILKPISDRITGRPKEGAEETDVLPSDDPNRDAMALVHAGESLVTEMHQSLVPQFSKPEYRGATIVHGTEAARRAAAMAMIINPDNLVNPDNLLNANLDVPTTTTEAVTTTTQNIAQSADNAPTTTAPPSPDTIQQYYAIPSQFGTLSAVQLAVGAFSSNAQFTINIETPSLNSFIYDYETDC